MELFRNQIICLIVISIKVIDMYYPLGYPMRLRHLAIILSKLEAHPCENVDFEQYSTDGNIASQFISSIVSFGDISPDSVVADLGAGNGILGIGALKVGAKKCIFLEVDKKACEILHNNLLSVGLTESGVIINELLDSETELSKVDLVICNPPWGRQKEKADRPFLNQIIKNGVVSHLMHSSHSTHIQPFFESRNWTAEKYGEVDFILPANFSHHREEKAYTKVAFWRLSPN